MKRCAASHPFWTGRSGVVDTAGHLERLRRRYADTIVTPHRLTA
ncbi:50S ribosomal protein L31 [Brachybacterium vulturis]|nr:50S ribosomal protein L31 [Brachybacterium vulturis]